MIQKIYIKISLFSSEVKVRVIEYDASGFKRPENTRHQEYVVQEINIHPQFDPTRLSYDLAVLKVETKPDGFGGIKGRIDLTATDDVNSACLPGCPNMFGHKFANGTGVRYALNIISSYLKYRMIN